MDERKPSASRVIRNGVIGAIALGYATHIYHEFKDWANSDSADRTEVASVTDRVTIPVIPTEQYPPGVEENYPEMMQPDITFRVADVIANGGPPTYVVELGGTMVDPRDYEAVYRFFDAFHNEDHVPYLTALGGEEPQVIPLEVDDDVTERTLVIGMPLSPKPNWLTRVTESQGPYETIRTQRGEGFRMFSFAQVKPTGDMDPPGVRFHQLEVVARAACQQALSAPTIEILKVGCSHYGTAVAAALSGFSYEYYSTYFGYRRYLVSGSDSAYLAPIDQETYDSITAH